MFLEQHEKRMLIRNELTSNKFNSENNFLFANTQTPPKTIY